AVGLESAPPFLRAVSIARSPSSPSVIYASVWAPATVPGTVFKSTDSGATFAPTSQAGIPPTNLATRGRINVAVHPTKPDHVYALVALQSSKQAGFARSTDGGTTWTSVDMSQANILSSQGSNCIFIGADPTAAGTLYAGGLDAWKSTDEGDTWTKISDWSPPTVPPRPLPYLHSDQHLIVWGADGTPYIGNDGGIFAKTGTSFKGLNAQIVGYLVDEICTNAGGSIIMVGSQDNGTPIMRENGRWDQIGGGDGYGCRVNPTNDLSFTISATNQNIQFSRDGGKTFADSTGLTEAGDEAKSSFRTAIIAHPTVSGRIFTYTKHKIWQSNDDGQNWTKLSRTMPVISDIEDLTISTDGTTMALIEGDGMVLTSVDGGETWTVLSKYPIKGGELRLRIASAGIYVNSTIATKGKERLWLYSFDSKTWTPLSKTGQADGIPDLPIWTFEVDPVTPSVLWAGSYMGVYRSGDSGATWARHGTALPNVPVTAITFHKDGSAIIVGTSGRGIFRAPTSVTGSIAILTPSPLVAPVPGFTYAPSTPKPGHLVVFTDDSHFGTKWSWDFGDGSPVSHDIGPEHIFTAAGTYNVALTLMNSAGQTANLTKAVTVAYAGTGTGDALSYLVPVIVRAAGSGGTSFSSELTLTNRAGRDLALTFTTKDGSGTYTLKAGQEIYPDVFAFLKTRGLNTPDGTALTTLRIEVRGAAELSQFAALARVTTPPGPDLRAQGIAGRFGLALSAAPLLSGASKNAAIYGLKQIGVAGISGARSNLACSHAGGGSLGSVKLEVTYHDGDTGLDHASKDTFQLAAFAWDQRGTPFVSRGIVNGWATIKRVTGDDQFVCYGTVMDNVSGDSSYLEMIRTDTKSTKSHALLPVVVDTGGYKTELTIANRTLDVLGAEFVVVSSNGEKEYGELEIEALSQKISSDIVGELRAAGFDLPNGSVASLYFTFGTVGAGGGKSEGHVSPISATDVFVGGRTYATKGTAGGQFGLAYPYTVVGDGADTDAYIYGLQQSGTRGEEGGTRSNVAVVHAFGGNDEPLGLEITYFSNSGTELGKENVTLNPGQWNQIGQPLARYPGITQGYARIRRISGSDEFVAYGVLNDQANDDGSFVRMVVP
ncbi:MAG: PKD domain-containing protein, partial [Thermoanaerobaculia bacterium]